MEMFCLISGSIQHIYAFTEHQKNLNLNLILHFEQLFII